MAGQTAEAHTHVTRLADFTPVVDGRVEIVLVDASGEQVFGADQVLRPGIFDIEVTPRQAGDADVLFRIHDAEGTEEIRGGRVRVGTADDPGGLLDASSLPAGSDGGEPISFLKEQQWQSSFATAWVEEGRLAESVAGLATFRPPAGGESTVTAQVDGVVQPPGASTAWPFVGRYVERDSPLFRVVPLVALRDGAWRPSKRNSRHWRRSWRVPWHDGRAWRNSWLSKRRVGASWRRLGFGS